VFPLRINAQPVGWIERVMGSFHYIVNFNRDRDSYQVPLALAEVGVLGSLITDFYVPGVVAKSWLGRILRVSHRYIDGVSFEKVSWCLGALWLQTAGLRLAGNEAERLRVFKDLDRLLSLKACRVARSTGADLFLYSGYALECFSSFDMANRRKVLFVFHPHATLSAEILQRDIELHPEMAWSHALHRDEMAASDLVRLDQELSLAGELVCASTFTKRSVERAGVGMKPVAVVPYGCEVPAVVNARTPLQGRKVRLLYVGQGVQRKGLHHLLKVWKRRASWDAELTVVAGKLDPGAGRLAEAQGPAVRLLPAVPRAALNDEFARADVFVMPSLIEGFGLVYLEALAFGCHVIGTENTGLPDIAAPDYAATISPAGNLDALEDSLVRSIALVRSEGYSAELIRNYARTRSWAGFRAGIRQSIGLPREASV